MVVQQLESESMEAMAKFNVSVDHTLPRDEALQRMQTFSDSLKEDLPTGVSDVVEAWESNGDLTFGFSAMGFKVAGLMKTQAEAIVIDGTLPFAALPFRGTIENELATKVREALATRGPVRP